MIYDDTNGFRECNNFFSPSKMLVSLEGASIVWANCFEAKLWTSAGTSRWDLWRVGCWFTPGKPKQLTWWKITPFSIGDTIFHGLLLFFFGQIMYVCFPEKYILVLEAVRQILKENQVRCSKLWHSLQLLKVFLFWHHQNTLPFQGEEFLPGVVLILCSDSKAAAPWPKTLMLRQWTNP